MRAVYGVVTRNEFARLRTDGFDILNRHPAVLEKLLEWADVVNRYLDNFNAGRLAAADLEQTILMSVEEMIPLTRRMAE
ncbi:MAG TPA: hypothetical protein DDZ11_11590, partial [Lentisphaeria bacterium]|nr:hypothetical protein [Lentisphaeria bacterium]